MAGKPMGVKINHECEHGGALTPDPCTCNATCVCRLRSCEQSHLRPVVYTVNPGSYRFWNGSIFGQKHSDSILYTQSQFVRRIRTLPVEYRNEKLSWGYPEPNRVSPTWVPPTARKPLAQIKMNAEAPTDVTSLTVDELLLPGVADKARSVLEARRQYELTKATAAHWTDKTTTAERKVFDALNQLSAVLKRDAKPRLRRTVL